MDEVLEKFATLLPAYEEIAHLLKNDHEAEYILRRAIVNADKIRHASAKAIKEECQIMLQILIDRYWEKIHTGHFSKVPLETRQIYTLVNYYKIIYTIFDSFETNECTEKCIQLLDNAMLLGYSTDLYERCDELSKEFEMLFNQQLGELKSHNLVVLKPLERQKFPCDITQIDCPAILEFERDYYITEMPVLLLNTIKHWPAITKWYDINYISNIAGRHHVPIEIGANYAQEDWSQQLIKLNDFLKRQFSIETPSTTNDDEAAATVSSNQRTLNDVEYLAQHELFDQIPALKSDICIPDYCAIGENPDNIDIKAWLGPKGTISPLHYDPKHNFLCQVFGMKKIILAAPTDTPNLYAHETELLGNTSSIDAGNIDLINFPLLENVKFYHVTLQEGDCLYIPPKWWHYVRSESPSFSVSFWWE